jgi:hypothetical protein
MNGEVQSDLLRRSVTNVKFESDKVYKKTNTINKKQAKSKVAQNIKVANKVKADVVTQKVAEFRGAQFQPQWVNEENINILQR